MSLGEKWRFVVKKGNEISQHKMQKIPRVAEELVAFKKAVSWLCSGNA